MNILQEQQYFTLHPFYRMWKLRSNRIDCEPSQSCIQRLTQQMEDIFQKYVHKFPILSRVYQSCYTPYTLTPQVLSYI